jgi:ankyrin repeat protein
LTSEEQRCAEAEKFRRLDAAFKAGDLEALRAAVDDPSVLPNGIIHLAVGCALVYAIYWSPLPFIAQLLESGADPNVPVDDGFPPLIAALMTARDEPGSNRRTDVDDMMRLLLAHGADPNQRGINDYTALHTAVAERNANAVRLLLAYGADPALRTRIDDYETPLELARSAGLSEIAAILEAGNSEN